MQEGGLLQVDGKGQLTPELPMMHPLGNSYMTTDNEDSPMFEHIHCQKLPVQVPALQEMSSSNQYT